LLILFITNEIILLLSYSIANEIYVSRRALMEHLSVTDFREWE
jgi:hypothetical protein